LHSASLAPEVFRERLAGLEEQRLHRAPRRPPIIITAWAARRAILSARVSGASKDETPLLGRARLVTDHGRYADVEGRIEEFTGARVVATGRFVFVPGASAT